MTSQIWYRVAAQASPFSEAIAYCQALAADELLFEGRSAVGQAGG